MVIYSCNWQHNKELGGMSFRDLYNFSFCLLPLDACIIINLWCSKGSQLWQYHGKQRNGDSLSTRRRFLISFTRTFFRGLIEKCAAVCSALWQWQLHNRKLQIQTLLPIMSTAVQNKLKVHVFLFLCKLCLYPLKGEFSECDVMQHPNWMPTGKRPV